MPRPVATVPSIFALGLLALGAFGAVVAMGCGGSGSETPWPVEPDNVDLGPEGEARRAEELRGPSKAAPHESDERAEPVAQPAAQSAPSPTPSTAPNGAPSPGKPTSPGPAPAPGPPSSQF